MPLKVLHFTIILCAYNIMLSELACGIIEVIYFNCLSLPLHHNWYI